MTCDEARRPLNHARHNLSMASLLDLEKPGTLSNSSPVVDSVEKHLLEGETISP